MKINTGDQIYALRKGRGMTQEQLAAEIGVSAAAVSKWESRGNIPDVDTLCLLADYFEVTVDVLLGRESAGGETWERGCRTAGLLLELSEISRQQGLLAMESALRARADAPPFLMFAGSLAMDWLGANVPPAQIEELLNRYAESLPEGERTQGRMIVKGLMLIVSGEHPDIIKEWLAAFWGFEFREEFYRALSEDGTGGKSEKERSGRIAAWKREHEGKGCYSPATAILEEFVHADSLLIRLMLRSLENVDAVCILQGSSYEMGCRVLNNLSERLAGAIVEEAGRCPHTEEELVAGLTRARSAIEDIRRRVMKDSY